MRWPKKLCKGFTILQNHSCRRRWSNFETFFRRQPCFPEFVINAEKDIFFWCNLSDLGHVMFLDCKTCLWFRKSWDVNSIQHNHSWWANWFNLKLGISLKTRFSENLPNPENYLMQLIYLGHVMFFGKRYLCSPQKSFVGLTKR